MMGRLPRGGRINRDHPLPFTFNGVAMQGYEGDTIASALLANGVRVVSRSFKYRRPRGIFSAGAEEPNAIVTVGTGAFLTPNVRATITPLVADMVVRSQSGYPSVNQDIWAPFLSLISAAMPVGFYYKTFLFSQKFWQFCEKYIRRAASSAPVPRQPDGSAYAHRYAHCDVLIIGGGPAGIAAALVAAQNPKARVILADSAPELGGSLLSEESATIDDNPDWLAQSTAAIAAADNITVLPNTTIQGYHDYNYLIGLEAVGAAATDISIGKSVRERLWKIRARQVIIATGAIERPLVFAGNDTPGVMLASAVQTYIVRYGVLPGERILFFLNNDDAYAAAIAASRAGAEVEIVDVRDSQAIRFDAQAHKIKVYSGSVVSSALQNGERITAQIAHLHGDTIENYASHAYDVIGVSAGWTPTVHLFSQARGQLQWSNTLGAFKPKTADPLNPCAVAGSANGQMELAACLREGNQAAVRALLACGFADAATTAPPPPAAPLPSHHQANPPLHLPWVPAVHPVGIGRGKHFVDFYNDVTAADILLAAREGYQSVEHMKRYTAAGFGTEQGKTGNINALVTLARALGKKPEEVGHTTYRPQYTPVSFGAVAGINRRELYAPKRTTPMEPWHQKHHAVYEDVGDWRRPRYFPVGEETMDEAVWRECKAARSGVAAMDATTLGKIDVQGADAAVFLDRVYTNLMSTLPVGRCRYGLMLRETGMIFDDGVLARLGERHFHLTTSTGHAASVMTWLEELLQTEWPELRVFCTSVTEQWAVVALVGPKARALLAKLTDTPLDNEHFPFMTVQNATVAGIPARLFRVSFSGEVAFEINVPARYGLHLWETLFKKGKADGITAYGTETMHVLRAEKGYIIVGQDSDGTMIPNDLGLSWMVSKKKDDFIGKRSLARPDMLRSGRLQFVGLQPTDPQQVIPEGAQLVDTDAPPPPVQSQGFVTSSYMSPTLERSIALGMLSNGFKRHGDTINAIFVDGKQVEATVTAPVFWDQEGKTLHS